MTAQTDSACFPDGRGTVWRINLSSSLVEFLNREAGIDLRRAWDVRTWKAMGTNGGIARVLWDTCEAQAVELGVTPEEFVSRMEGRWMGASAVLARACTSLVDPGKLPALTKLISSFESEA